MARVNDVKNLNLSVEVEVAPVVIWRLRLFVVLMRFAAWVGGFGSFELELPDGETVKKTLGRTPREYEHFCVCGHNEDMHCAFAAPFNGANTACANGGCTCNEFRDSKG